MILIEGTYDIPDDCTVLYRERKVIVKKMKLTERPRVYHCHDCIFQKIGRKARRVQIYESPYCELRPKILHGEGGFYYCAPDSRIACYMFKKKEEKK